MATDSSLQQAFSTIPQSLAVGYVDLTASMLLGIETLDPVQNKPG